ncbi:MAG: MFS transporter [Ruthenibacterium sp.]
MFQKKPTSSEIDGIKYRRVPTWQVALGQLQCGSGMAFYILVGLMSYLATEGYGIALAAAGVILSATRIFDGLIDPLLAVWIDRFHSRFGKLRFMLLLGWAIRGVATLFLFVWASDGTHGAVMFIVMYMLYILGNSIYDIAGNMVPAIMTNDPKQRPTIQVWSTVYNYLFPMIFSLVSTLVVLPMYDNKYTVPMMAMTCLINMAGSLILVLIACIGLTPIDKPENFENISAGGAQDKVSGKDMLQFLKGNRPFQMYVIAAVSDKLAQQVNSQAIVTTMLFGILIGNIQFGSILSMASMLPAILFAIIGARYAGKYGNKESTITWTWVCTAIAAASIVFCLAVDLKQIPTNIGLMVVFFSLLLLMNGAKMCVTTANGAMRADIVDYELDRSGKYIPAIVTATYNFIDQFVTSLGATIATGCVALIGYVHSAPQPTDAATSAILAVTLLLYFGMPIFGWVCTLVAMRFYKLTKSNMVEVQKSVHAKKQEALKAKG